MKQKIITKLCMFRTAVEKRLTSNSGFYVDSLIKILIAVVVGAVLLGLLVALMNAIFPELQTKIMEMFNGGGTSSTASTASVI